MAKTFLQTVNNVLTLLREDTVSSVSDTSYSSLIGKFVELSVQDVENSWDWNTLRSTIQASTTADNSRYILTAAGHYSTILLATCTDSAGNTYELSPINFNTMTKFFREPNPQSSQPVYYSIAGYDANDDPVIDLYPTPDSVYTVNFDVVVRTTDDLADTDTISVPNWPVVLGAYYRAVEERGESGSTTATSAMMEYRKSLGAAILADSSYATHELEFRVV